MDRWSILSWGMLLSLGSLACSESTKTEAQVTIAFITPWECSALFEPARRGAAQAKADLSSASGRPVEVLLMEPKCESADAGPPVDAGACVGGQHQNYLIQEAIDRKMDAIVIAVFDRDCATPLINEAVDKGIKVITWNSDAPESKRHVYYGYDNYAIGGALMDALATINGKAGKFIVQTTLGSDGKPYGAHNQARSQAIADTLKNYPNMEHVSDINCDGVNNADPFCAKEAELALSEHPDIVGFLFARGKLLREPDLSTNAPMLTARVKANSISSVSFDAYADAIPGIRGGYAKVALGGKRFGWGYDTVLLAYDLATIPGLYVEPFVDSGWYTVCPNNLDEFEANMQAQDYRSELSKCSLLP